MQVKLILFCFVFLILQMTVGKLNSQIAWKIKLLYMNHVIISFWEIEEEMCEIKCYLEPNCRSYNYGLLTNGTFLCELSDTQHMQALPNELEARNGFNYRSIEQVRLYIKVWLS